MKVEWVRVDAPVPVGFWRSVGNSINAFTMESFMDELAHAAGWDPLDFRLDCLPEGSRPKRLLKALAEKAGWGSPLPPGRFRGVAQHFSFGSYVAHVAEVSVDKESGAITVHRIVCAADCGAVINTDTAAAQLQGATLMGLSAALKEKISFKAGGVDSSNFDDYPVLRFPAAPEVEAYLFPSGEVLGGLGEPGLPPVAPAVANAVFAATGNRMRKLPLAVEF
jgi:isoquinoline 1-oxidoreductase subunit beta